MAPWPVGPPLPPPRPASRGRQRAARASEASSSAAVSAGSWRSKPGSGAGESNLWLLRTLGPQAVLLGRWCELEKPLAAAAPGLTLECRDAAGGDRVVGISRAGRVRAAGAQRRRPLERTREVGEMLE